MRILVIGAGQGLGKVLPDILAENGHEVLVGLRKLEQKKNWPEKWQSQIFETDVTKPETVEAVAEALAKDNKRVDAVISCAGVLLDDDRSMRLAEQNPENLRKSLEVNAMGILHVYQAFARQMARGGKMLFLTSEGGSLSVEGEMFPAYSVSKTTANKIVQILRLGASDFEVFAVHPGRMNTTMGRTTYQIEPEETAYALREMLEGKVSLNNQKHWFIDYEGKAMDL